ncbi:hypothetical protein TWF788_007605 [Orbilia oligospora]|uniref:SH3 domain-containing protein n=1 Tax=Orbilia oligospora TaxID=2813651 RepID=A0A7C8PSB0_ORBOL|nr:hypothetical protein TWF788_007605 [Orbilia oligospora]
MDHSNHILRHAHHLRKRVPMPEPQGGTKTVVEVVFVTQPPSFDGEPAGFVTVNPQDDPTSVEAATADPTPTSSPSRPKQQSVAPQEESEKEEIKTTMRTSTRSQSSVISSASIKSVVESSTIATTTPSRTTAFGGVAATLGSTTSAALPSETEAATNSAGLTIGAYAGIVGGGVALIMVVVVVIAVMLKKRNNKNYEKPEDEKNMKHLSFSDRSTPSPVPPVLTPKPAMAPAPKLEIRPMTQFDGSFFPAGNSDTMRSQDRPIKAPPPALSIDPKNLTPGPFETPEPSPALSAFSDSSNITLPIQGATGGPNSSSPVHRVTVDFKPSMADELELRAGEVVRLLHEYDDGWALCIRMDRTQQGVCPRTCLSPKAVKPRPPPPGIRGPGGPPHPYSPSAGRPQSPSFGPGSRPQSPRSPGPNRPPMSPKGMPGPPRRPMRPDSRPESPMSARPPHPLSRVQRDDDVQFHAM